MVASAFFENLVLFGRLLRDAGLPVSSTRMAELVEALGHTGIHSAVDVRDAVRALLAKRPEHLPLIDRAFDLFWHRLNFGDSGLDTRPRVPEPRKAQSWVPLGLPRPTQEQSQEALKPLLERQPTASANELLRRKDFSDLTAEEHREVRRMLESLRWNPRLRRTRRRIPARSGRFLDLRATQRRNRKRGGELIDLAWRRQKEKRRPLVLLCDISGSMEAYSRLLLQFVFGITNGLERTEAFVFGTRLTRITRPLQTRDPDQALKRVADAVADWAGGTRIGEALKQFNQLWSRRVLGQGAIVGIISDGWECGDVSELERQMQRLRRSCKRILWLNPLLGSPDYQPLSRGIRAVLPVVDDFLPVHNLESLEQLGDLLSRVLLRPDRAAGKEIRDARGPGRGRALASARKTGRAGDRRAGVGLGSAADGIEDGGVLGR